MQLMLTPADMTVAQLRDVAELLNREAERRDPEATRKLLQEIERQDAPQVPGGTQSESTVAQPPATVFPGARNPAEVFGQKQDFVVPVIPPPPPAPTVQAETAPATTSTPASAVSVASSAVDRDGLPHDTRIHSAEPKINADGRWRKKRNLDNTTLVQVEAELRSRNQVPLPLAPAIPPPPPVVAAPNAPALGPQATATVMVPPPPPVAGSVSAGQDAGTVDPFRDLMRRISPHTGEGGRLATDVMRPVHAEFGAAGWQDYYAKCRVQIPALLARIEGLLA